MTAASIEQTLYSEAGYCCMRPACGACWPDHVLHIHHIRERHRSGSDAPDNLAVLCAQCHADLHAGRYTVHDVETWKRSRQMRLHGTRDITAHQALKYELPRLDKSQRNEEVLLLVTGLLHHADGEGGPEVRARLILAGARAQHRIGRAWNAVSTLEAMFRGRAFDALHPGTGLLAEHYYARAAMQSGALNVAAEAFAGLTDPKRAIPYGFARLRAQAAVDRLNLSFHNLEPFPAVLDTALATLSVGWHKSRVPSSVRAELYMYQALARSMRCEYPAAIADMQVSLGLTRRGNSRGLAIRLGWLGLIHLRQLTTAKIGKRQPSFRLARSAFLASLSATRLPNESYSFVMCSLGIERTYLKVGRDEDASIWRAEGLGAARLVGVSVPLVDTFLDNVLHCPNP